MGKMLNALRTANGDIPELVLQCLDDGHEAPAARVTDAILQWPACGRGLGGGAYLREATRRPVAATGREPRSTATGGGSLAGSA